MSQYMPKTLYHPAEYRGRAAVIEMDARGRQSGILQQGEPGRYPPVGVTTQDEEDYYRARGYLAQGERQPVTEFSRWPMIMIHPKHVEPVPERKDKRLKPDGVTMEDYTIPGIPEEFPHVWVSSDAEVEEFTERGWRVPGHTDLKVANDAREIKIEGYQPQQWPKMVAGKTVDDPAKPADGPADYPKYVLGEFAANPEQEAEIRARLAPPEPPEPDTGEMTDARIKRLVAERVAASERGDDGRCDEIERSLAEHGVTLKDKPHGTVWTRAVPPATRDQLIAFAEPIAEPDYPFERAAAAKERAKAQRAKRTAA